MTNEQINIAIAETMGAESPYWNCPTHGEITPDRLTGERCPWCINCVELIGTNYAADLNACHEFEKSFNNCEVKWGEYRHNLMFTLERERHELHATARQRCEAYLRTLGKWKEGA